MKRSATLGSLFLAFVASAASACGGSPAAEPAVPEPPPAAPEAPVASETPAPKPAPEPTPPTPEEKKKAEQERKLQEDRAKLEADHKAEVARWTPELRAEAKALADKNFPTGKAAITAALASKVRQPGNADRDKYRNPLGTLEFFGFKPSMTVIEYSPGGGYYTELLAPALAKRGKLIVTNSDPNGPADSRSSYYGQRVKLLLDRSPELFGKVQTVIVDSKVPSLGIENKADLIVVMRELHGMQNAGTLDAWLAEFNKALKPGGVLGIEEHRANRDADPVESAKHGYMPETYVIEKAEAAGFKLAGMSEINANAKDTKDHPAGVWTLPPSFALKDKDRDKYASIGESDRMTLKFVKEKKIDLKPGEAKASGKVSPAKKAD
ncbi:MAG: methyltransferase [Polyangiaceae bacterium]|nr:methyltransferase [Polyangiaceae bacterium]